MAVLPPPAAVNGNANGQGGNHAAKGNAQAEEENGAVAGGSEVNRLKAANEIMRQGRTAELDRAFEQALVLNTMPAVQPADQGEDTGKTLLETLIPTRAGVVLISSATVSAATGMMLFDLHRAYWLASLVTARPIWRQFDPLGILDDWEEESATANGEDEDVERMFDKKRAKTPERGEDGDTSS